MTPPRYYTDSWRDHLYVVVGGVLVAIMLCVAIRQLVANHDATICAPRTADATHRTP